MNLLLDFGHGMTPGNPSSEIVSIERDSPPSRRVILASG
jgi:hypothetical protein